MRVLGISGSPRKDGNTEFLVKRALAVIEEKGIEIDYLSLAGVHVEPCTACGGCTKLPKGEYRCVLDDEGFEGVIERFRSADGIIVGSPVYFGSAAPQLMSVLDRVGYVARCGENFLSRKVGAAIAVARRAGVNFTFAQLNYFFLISDMIVPGSTYWNVAYGREKGQVAGDEEGLKTIDRLAENVAWLVRLTSETKK